MNTGATVTNDGTLKADGGTITFKANFQQDLVFSGAGTLVLPEAAAAGDGYIGHISGWDSTDTVDVNPLAFKDSYRVLIGTSGSTEGLFIIDSADNKALVAQINLAGQYVSRNFGLAADGGSGTLITEHDAGPNPPPAGLTLSPGSDSGVPGDDTTDVTTPTMTGTGETGDTVTLFDGATAVGSGTVQLDGSWSIATSVLAVGAHSLTATEVDPIGNVSGASPVLMLTIINAPPTNPPPADFNGDGKSDILWQNDSGLVYLWDMNDMTVAAQSSPGSADASWHIRGTGNFNGDGKSTFYGRTTAAWSTSGT